MSTAIDRVGSACPLCVVTCSFKRTRIVAKCTSSFNITHSSTKSNSICCNYSFFMTLICKHNTIVNAVSCIKGESTKINPCSATHCLVYLKFCSLSLMKDCIMCVINALRKCLITNVYCVLVSL